MGYSDDIESFGMNQVQRLEYLQAPANNGRE
jgi:hypothetical protein